MSDTLLQFDLVRQVVAVAPRGKLTGQRILTILQGILNHPDYRNGMAGLWDFRSADLLELPAHDMRLVSGYASTHRAELGTAPVALVASSPASFGVLRMYEVLALGDSLPHRVFQDMGEAEAWLEQATAPPEASIA